MEHLGSVNFHGRPKYDSGGLITSSEVDTISGSLQTSIDEKSNNDHIHDDRYYTESEIDDIVTTISGKLDDHNELNNLDYALSGHTGFQPAGDYLTDSEFSTYSGTFQLQIDDKADTIHIHDDRYYTETEVDTISGSLTDEINTKDSYSSWTFAVDGISKDDITSGDVLNFVGGENITITRSAEDEVTISGSSGIIDHGSLVGLEDDDHTQYLLRNDFTTYSGGLQTQIDDKSELTHLHDDRYYTESEVDELITTISGKLDDHNELNNLDYISSGHTGFQPAGDYLTDTEFSTYSGTLQSQIDEKSGISHLHDDRYYIESEVDTISGSLNTKISAKLSNVSEDSTPELGGQLGVGEYDIKLDTLLSADGKYSGTTRDGVLGATIAFGKLVYLNTTDQRWELADAETTSGDVDLAIVLAGGDDGDTRLLLIDGFVRENDWSFTSYGQALYISTTSGTMTQTVVSGSGDIVRVVGKAGTTADQIHFRPSQVWIELS